MILWEPYLCHKNKHKINQSFYWKLMSLHGFVTATLISCFRMIVARAFFFSAWEHLIATRTPHSCWSLKLIFPIRSFGSDFSSLHSQKRSEQNPKIETRKMFKLNRYSTRSRDFFSFQRVILQGWVKIAASSTFYFVNVNLLD